MAGELPGFAAVWRDQPDLLGCGLFARVVVFLLVLVVLFVFFLFVFLFRLFFSLRDSFLRLNGARFTFGYESEPTAVGRKFHGAGGFLAAGQLK